MTVTDLPRATNWQPIPAGRGRWRLTLHRRQFVDSNFAPPAQTGIAELVDARSKRLEQTLNKPAQLSFTVDGRSQSARELRELAQDVIAWRWDEVNANDMPMFFGPVTHTEDQITADAHTVNVTCHDYLAVMSRRYLTKAVPLVFTQTDQDTLVGALLTQARSPSTGNNTDLRPGSSFPVQQLNVNPDGSTRNPSGVLRDRTYLGNQQILEAIDNLSASLPVNPQPGQTTSFDYDQGYLSTFTTYGWAALRVFWPGQGVTRSDMALVYGARGVGGLAGVTRTVDSGDYANYVRVLGNNGNSDQTAAQLFADTWNSDATSGTAGAVGLWMTADNASDVNQQATLNEKAAGLLAAQGVLIPSYTVTLVPDGYRYGFPNMGDTVGLNVQSGRLNVATTVRVLGLAFAANEDAAGGEDVTLTVGRPAVTLAQLLGQARSDINALARR